MNNLAHRTELFSFIGFSFINKVEWDEHKRDNFYQAGRPALSGNTSRSGRARFSGGLWNLSQPDRRAGA